MDFSKLGRENFSKMCDQLIKAEYPDSKQIDGSGGDEGVDSYIGIFNDKIRIFQYKFFLNPIHNAQKKQIIESLNTAKKKHKLEEWILCIPREFNPTETIMFNQLKKENTSIKLNYMGVTEIKNLLTKYPEIRDIYFKEDKISKQIKGIKDIFEQFKENLSFGHLHTSKWNMEAVSLFKFNIINITPNKLVESLEKNYSYNKSIGFLKFKEIEKEKFYKGKFLFKKGRIPLKMPSIDLEEDPFELRYPNYNEIDIWISDVTNPKSTIITSGISIFNSTKDMIELIKKLFDDCRVKDKTKLEDLDFNKEMKLLTIKTFASAIDTIQIESSLIEKAKHESGKEIDVKIKKNTIYGDQNLPRTNFVKKVMKYIEPIKSKGSSGILYFRARQSSKFEEGKQITFELHNDGRLRAWFLKKDFDNNKDLMKESVIRFVDKIKK